MLRKTALLLLFALLHSPNLSAQDLKNRTEEMYPFGTIIISSQSLPDKVYEAQKNKFIISVVFLEKGTSNIILNSVGTGFVSEIPGVVITARHVLKETLLEMDRIKTERIKSNPKFDYEYMFMGTIITNRAWFNFPFSLIATGEAGTFRDIMVLQTDMETMEKARITGDILSPNPYSILIKTSKFADADIGDKVYISGFAPIVAEYLDKNNKLTPVYVDMINRTFPAEVVEKIENMPVNKTGVKLLYKLHDSAVPGFSGGKVVNSQGQVIGMTISMVPSQNIIYVFSSKDIKQFLKDNKIK